MKKLKLFFALILFAENLLAQPTWSVTPSDFQYNMTMITELNVNGTYLRSTNDVIGAFSGGICRGVAQPIYNADRDKYYAYLTVYSNGPGDVINFKVYDSSTGVETNISRTITFAPDASVGSQFQPLVVADPALRSEAELITFGFDGVTYNALEIEGYTLNFFIDSSTYDITQLDPIFTVSPGAKVFINQIEQTSAVSETLDFSNDIVYQVLSEDKTLLNEFTITVKEPVSTNTSAGSGGASISLGGGNVLLGGATVITDVVTVTATTTETILVSTGGGGGGGGGSKNDPDFLITQSDDTTIVSEDGLEDIIVVNILSKPFNDVVLDIEVSDSTEVELSSKRIIFNKDDWSTPQLLTVKGVDDELVDGNSSTELRFFIVDSLSYNPYDKIDDKYVTVLNIDDESLPNFMLSESENTTIVNESGTTDQIGISLTYPPSDEVLIEVSSIPSDEIELSVTNLSFDSTNWNLEQFITVKGIDDEQDDGDQSVTITFEISSASSATEYLEVPFQNIIVVNENIFNPPIVPIPVFYKKDAVCYNGGAIKVLYGVDGTSVSLNLNGQKIAEKSIVNGEVIFSDLDQGTYVVGLNDTVKIINVGLDE